MLFCFHSHDCAIIMFIFGLVAEFLRCQEAARVCQTNRESAIHSDIQRRLTYRSRRVEFDQDVREAFDAQRAQHATRREAWSCVTGLPINQYRHTDFSSDPSSLYALGFSSDPYYMGYYSLRCRRLGGCPQLDDAGN